MNVPDFQHEGTTTALVSASLASVVEAGRPADRRKFVSLDESIST